MFGCVTSFVVFVEVKKSKRLWLVDEEGDFRTKKHKKEAVFCLVFRFVVFVFEMKEL